MRASSCFNHRCLEQSKMINQLKSLDRPQFETPVTVIRTNCYCIVAELPFLPVTIVMLQMVY